MSIDYMARETASNLRRNLLMTGASILCVAVSLTIVGVALILKQGVANATIQWQGGVRIEIFMNPNASSGENNAVAHQLAQMIDGGGSGSGSTGSPVKSFVYFNQQKSYDEFKKIFADQPTMVQSVQASDLPPSYRVVPRQASDVHAIATEFSSFPGVKYVQSAQKTVDTLLSVTGLLQTAMFVMAVALLVAALALILNSIRMAIFARRREVAVMKLVGATNWFIRVPFMLEGLIQGLLGAGLAFGGVFLFRGLVSSLVRHYGLHLFSSFVVSVGNAVGAGLFVLVVGSLVGAIGSGLAVRSFLDV
ncbi:MAG TPA: permease-like cell division protein FtsX [Acidimicrobiales bacterium]|nr:permease-like cell division protein FtsX [Acidimicrobiales bacterium]